MYSWISAEASHLMVACIMMMACNVGAKKL